MGSNPTRSAIRDRIEPVDIVTYSDISWFKPYMAHGSSEFRRQLIKRGLLEKKCHACGLTEWMGQPAPLQLDHIDGNRGNCMLDNLRILCPNCHALTPTYSGRNNRVPLDAKVFKKAYDTHVKTHGTPPSADKLYRLAGRTGGLGGTRHAARVQTLIGEDRPLSPKGARTIPNLTKIKWPSDKSLAKLLETKSRVEVGEMLGVSDNAVKKRIRTRGIPEPSKMRLRAPKSRKPVPLSPIAHGTINGYRAEIRRGIPPCDECRKANTEHSRQYRQTRVPTES